MKINNHIAEKLFSQKEVSIHPEVYKSIYKKIWLCDDIFLQFLSEDDHSVKIDYAKKIYSYLQAFIDPVLPSFLINNVIFFQQHKLIQSSGGYIPQDHIAHSINLYIFGIYTAFNVPLFFQKLIEDTDSTDKLTNKAESFIHRWRAFALFHDIGYFFEGYSDKKGLLDEIKDRITEYENIFSQILYIYATRSTAKLITTQTLIKRSTTYLSNADKEYLVSLPWEENAPTKGTNLRLLLDEYCKARKIKDVRTLKGLLMLSDVLKMCKCLVVVYENELRPIGLITANCGRLTHYFYFDKESLFCNAAHAGDSFISFLQAIQFNYIIKCYVENIEALNSTIPIEYRGLSNNFYEDLPQAIKINFSLITDEEQIEHCYFNIFRWLIDKTEKHILQNNHSESRHFFKENISPYYKIALKKSMEEICDSMIPDDFDEKSKIESALMRIITELQKSETFKETVNEVLDIATQSYQNECGIPQVIADYLENALHYMKCSLGMQKSQYYDKDGYISRRIKGLQFISLQRADPLKHYKTIPSGKEKSFEIKLFDQICTQAKRLGTTVKNIKEYNTPYSAYDHGIISAGIIYQSVCLSRCIAEFASAPTDHASLWRYSFVTEISEENALQIYANAIFAVLIHNIYTKESAPDFGLSYKHSIDIDPFSYFCAFLDTLQVWQRPKQVDYSVVDLASKNYLYNNFDAIISNGKIQFVCGKRDAQYLEDMICGAETFLPGISRIVSTTY